MAKRTSSLNFKNAELRVTKDEINGDKRIFIIEQEKDEEIYTDFDTVLDMFGDESGLSITIKVDKRLDE